MENNIISVMPWGEEVSLAISHFYNYATNYQIDDYLKHYLPTIVEPYETEDGFPVTKINITENTRHDFRIDFTASAK